MRSFEKERLVVLLNEFRMEQESVFDGIAALKEESLKNFAFDYSYWDEMFNFANKPDLSWAKNNIEPSLSTYKADVALIFNKESSLLYFTTSQEGFSSGDFNFNQEIIKKLFEEVPLRRFFIMSPLGLLEFRSASIHPGFDLERKTPPGGYFFVGKLWDGEFMAEFGKLSKSIIRLEPVDKEKELFSGDISVKDGTIWFSRAIYSPDNKPLMRINVTSEFKGIRSYIAESRRNFMLLSLMTIISSIILFVFLWHWLHIPLISISRALTTQNSAPLKKIELDETEFGDIARLIDRFLRQKEKLTLEIAERKKVEAEMERAYKQLKLAQSQLLQSSKMASVGLLAGGVAHEINNPLTGVLNNVQLIKMMVEQKKDFKFEDFKELLGVIEESAIRCKKITQSLLDFSRVPGKSFHPVSVNEIVQKVLELVAHEINLQSIVIETDFSDGLPQIKGNYQLLQQVIFDLIANAKWAVAQRFPQAAAGGVITVKTQLAPTGNTVDIYVSDNGVGIASENIPKAFDPFFTTKTVGEGTGLGLSIVYNIVKEHMGNIEIVSGQGEGATFKVSLPVL
jgi:signal transduction histidine kinase